MSKKRVGAMGVAVALLGGYLWGGTEARNPGTTDAAITDARIQAATLEGHGIGAARDVIAVAGPALGDLGSMAGAAGNAAGATADPLADSTGGG